MIGGPPPARLLDVSRLISRAGRVLTGVDRVELAYLRAVLDDPVPGFALARTALGYVLLDEAGMTRLVANIEQNHWPLPDFASRMNAKLTSAARRGQTAVRRLAKDRAPRWGLARMLARRLPSGFAYINVGHSNLTKRVMNAVKAQSQSQITVMLHDAIPLEYPTFQKPEAVTRFAALLARVSQHADLVLCVSEAERVSVEKHLTVEGRVPEMMAAHIGLETVAPAHIPDGLAEEPFFMTIGTIEPRKNHALLLDVWDDLGPDAPRLLICGPRGWKNEAVFARLDANNPLVVERSDLDDGVLRALLGQTQGLLFPSFAEGFGLPPVEGIACGAPVLCANLAVYREILGSKPVYLDPNDRYQWKKAVNDLANAERSREEQPFDPPTWDAHFKTVFTKT